MWAVRFEEVQKRYRKGPRYTSLRTDLSSVTRRFIGRGRVQPDGLLALDDVSFEVAQGSAFALVGANGAGKSTALRLISRITYPTAGRVLVRGRVGALIEVGSGIQHELSGRDNIWSYGTILGLSRSHIRERFDEIVEFSELGSFLDMAVKHYSTGMQLRLGFSIAAFLEPDVFVVDEALSVGDVAFQAKCVERMNTLIRSGTTLLFVSHDLATVETLCNRAVRLDNGRLVDEGSARDVLERYLTSLERQRLDLRGIAGNDGELRVVTASTHDAQGRETRRFATGDPLRVRIEFESEAPIERPHVGVFVTDGRPGVLIECSMLDDGQVPATVPRRWTCECRLNSLPLRPRPYEVWVRVAGADGHTRLVDPLLVARFAVDAPVGEGPSALSTAAFGGALWVPYEWHLTFGDE